MADCTRISDQTVRQIKQCPSRKLVVGPSWWEARRAWAPRSPPPPPWIRPRSCQAHAVEDYQANSGYPHSCWDHTVVLCQGDIMLCPSCTKARYGNAQNETPEQKGATNTAETTGKDYVVQCETLDRPKHTINYDKLLVHKT